jgi:hypothetical protein
MGMQTAARSSQHLQVMSFQKDARWAACQPWPRGLLDTSRHFHLVMSFLNGTSIPPGRTHAPIAGMGMLGPRSGGNGERGRDPAAGE